MCIKILEMQGKIVPAEYNFFLKGGVVLDRENQMDNPCSGKKVYIGFAFASNKFFKSAKVG